MVGVDNDNSLGVLSATRDGKVVAMHGLWSRRWSTKSNGLSYPVQRAAEALYSVEGKAQVNALIDQYMANAKALRVLAEGEACRL